jgi:hypothetical protein
LNDPEGTQSRIWDIAMEITGSIGYGATVVMKPVDDMARPVAIHPEMRRPLQE